MCDLLELEERLAQGDIEAGKVVFWVNSPEHGKAAQEFATMAAWRNSLMLARNYPEAKPTVLYPANIALPLTGGDLVEARGPASRSSPTPRRSIRWSSPAT